MDPGARDILRRAVVRRELLLLVLLPLCAFGGAVAGIAAEAVYRRSGFSSLFFLFAIYWGISIPAGPAQVGARLIGRRVTARRAHEVPWRHGARGPLLGRLPLTVVLGGGRAPPRGGA